VSDSSTAHDPTSRRNFLRKGALAAVTLPAAAQVLAACSPDAKAVAAPVAAAHSDEHMPAAPASAPAAAPKSASARADEMDAMHEAGIKAFPAKTAGKGNQRFEPRLEKGVKVFDLTAREVQWEVSPGKTVKAWAYNGQVPGPQIRVREGDRVRINLKNELAESTAIHFHGLELPNDQDGVPFVTQPPVKPGASYTYEFTVPNAGSHMYHSHHNAAVQVGLGLLGAFIVEPKDRRSEPKADVDYVMVLNDGMHGYTLNGKGFPATEPVVCNLGQTVRLRFMNEGMMIHPMHLHGMHMTVVAKDGWPQPMPWKCDTLNIAPGERWDVIVKANNPGTWAFHCHILTHAESDHGMFGMVTALVVRKPGTA
jgi:manganese oxidase